TLMRPRSFAHGTISRIGFGDMPAVQTNVELTILSPSLSSISFGRTAATLLFARISRRAYGVSCPHYRPASGPTSAKCYCRDAPARPEAPPLLGLDKTAARPAGNR